MRLSVLIAQHAEKEQLPGDPGLTHLGRAQAAATAAWIATNESPVAVYSGPMRRARQTAEPIAARLGLRVVVDPRLRERMNWEGPERQSLEEFLAEWHRATVDRTFCPSTGDSSAHAAERFLELLNDLADAHGDATVVAVTHGGVTTDLLRTIAGDDRLSHMSPAVIDHGVPCCAITRLLRQDGCWGVESVAATAHLDGSMGGPLV